MLYSYTIIGPLAVFILSFGITLLLAPYFIRFLHHYRLGKSIRASGNTPVFTELHKKKEGVPTMGGLLVWTTVAFLAIILAVLEKYFPGSFFERLNFLDRSQTWVPLGALVFAGAIGAFDDLLNIFKIGPNGGGFKVKTRLLLYSLVAAGGAWWFYFKLGWDTVNIPGRGDATLGFWYIPFFILVVVATSFSLNETDGLDGLAGGVALTSFAAFGLIAFTQGKFELTALIAAIMGALLTFIWFNIYPAAFFMGDTGSMALGTTLGVIAMLTDKVFALPIVAIVLVLESSSVIIQLASKKFRGRKIFLSAPIHHHFEALGWPETKVTMRFWIISGVAAIFGLIAALAVK